VRRRGRDPAGCARRAGEGVDGLGSQAPEAGVARQGQGAQVRVGVGQGDDLGGGGHEGGHEGLGLEVARALSRVGRRGRGGRRGGGRGRRTRRGRGHAGLARLAGLSVRLRLLLFGRGGAGREVLSPSPRQ